MPADGGFHEFPTIHPFDVIAVDLLEGVHEHLHQLVVILILGRFFRLGGSGKTESNRCSQNEHTQCPLHAAKQSLPHQIPLEFKWNQISSRRKSSTIARRDTFSDWVKPINQPNLVILGES